MRSRDIEARQTRLALPPVGPLVRRAERPLRVLVGCEHTGTVRDAFRALGHDAVSCDLLPTEVPGPHIEGDLLEHLRDGSWDLLAHPPCTHLALSGARWFAGGSRAHPHGKEREQKKALRFFRALLNAPIPKICLENPMSIASSRIRKKDQSIQPFWFGDPYEKTTWLWLKNLPPLVPTSMVATPPRHRTRSGRTLPAWYSLPPSPERWKLRSRTFPGIARAMAAQWGGVVQR